MTCEAAVMWRPVWKDFYALVHRMSGTVGKMVDEGTIVTSS